MSLPSLNILSFPAMLPSTGETVGLRPYLVREERLLLMAQESGNPHQIAESIGQVISNCTFDKVDPKKAPYFDIEWLLLQLRIRSVGDTVSPVYKCENVVDVENDTRCWNKVKFDIPLDKIQMPTVAPDNHIIKLSTDYHLYLKYPTIFDVSKFSSLLDHPLDEIDSLVDIFGSVRDVVNNVTHQFDDVPHSEKLEFLYGMSGKDIEHVTKFLSDMPVVQYDLPFACPVCKYNETITIKGLFNFFN